MIGDFLPSMFHRRLLLLGALLLFGASLPAMQLVRLTLVRGEQLREEAESKLRLERVLPTSRGRILDRKGRALAVDRPSYDIAVDYPVITGQWTFSQAARRARKAAGTKWTELSPIQREQLIEQYQPEFQQRLEQSWETFCRIGGISRDDLEARKAEIIAGVARAAANFHERKRLEKAEALARSRELSIDETEAEILTADVARPIREQSTAHVLLHGVADNIAFEFLPLADAGAGETGNREGAIPGLRVLDSSGRDYPFETVEVEIDRESFPGPLKSPQPAKITLGGVATHVVGMMSGRFTAADIDNRAAERAQRGIAPKSEDAGAYQQGDGVGRMGVERSSEYTLRGERGRLTERLDTQEEVRQQAVPGRDVQLTMDIMLQARVQALLDPQLGLTQVQPWHNNKTVDLNTPLAGAAVVLDVDTGDILALVTTPTFTREDLAERADEVLNDPISAAFVNRAVAKAYPPGSIVKPLIWCSAVSSGAVDASTHIKCEGHLFPDKPTIFQCWVWKQFQTTHDAQLGHDLDVTDAIMASCNIFFYHMGRSLGPERIIDWYGRFGVGDASSESEIIHPRLGIGAQFSGIAGHGKSGHATSLSEATLMGIGQGPVAWTPLHAVDAFATIARGGVRIVPRLRSDDAPVTIDLKLDPRAIAGAMEGLRKAVGEDRGTGNHISVIDALGNTKREDIFNTPGVTVWGKSGTADAPKTFATDRDEDGEPVLVRDASGKPIILRQGDHSWFVGLVGPAGDRPRYAIAVVVDYGGSGGRVAGPIANQIIRALIDEGYLPRESESKKIKS